MSIRLKFACDPNFELERNSAAVLKVPWCASSGSSRVSRM